MVEEDSMPYMQLGVTVWVVAMLTGSVDNGYGVESESDLIELFFVFVFLQTTQSGLRSCSSLVLLDPVLLQTVNRNVVVFVIVFRACIEHI